jgi:two-component system sensor histidine kinase PilS (NtrC family)
LFFLIAVVSGSLAEQLRRARYSLNLTQSDLSSLTELHDSIVRSIPSGIITTSEADSITFINNAGLTFLNVPAQEVIGAPLAQVFPMGDKDLIAVGDHEETFLTQREVRGEQRSFELTLSDLNWPDELPRGRLVVFQDVTRMRKMEDRVKQSERQSAFVRIAAGLAHEIRNPLAALRGAAELLSRADEKVVPDKRLLSIIIRESDRLNGLLGDFLVTVNSGQRTKDRVMLTDLIQDTVDLFAKEAHLSEKASIETRLKKGVVVEGDPSRLKQALWNLLKNAVEAGSHNQVIRVTLESDGAQAALKVLDQGSGITPEIRARMFEPFATTKDRGTGLGLPLVLSVAEAHNGTVEVDSSPGIGTLFTLRLPILPGDSPKEGR